MVENNSRVILAQAEVKVIQQSWSLMRCLHNVPLMPSACQSVTGHHWAWRGNSEASESSVGTVPHRETPSASIYA